ncbi:fimbrial protein [Enterobacteriaceae bacterium RIT691]|nr:fimbrial protein [Enterobacteriaceae bacterium RIT691]
MSLSRFLSRLLFLVLLGCGVAHAECYSLTGSSSDSALFMDIGRVIVDADAPTGSVLATRSWTLRNVSTSYRCSGSNQFDARVMMPGSQDAGNGVWSTNIPGIGLRFTLKNNVGMPLSYNGQMNLNSGSSTDVTMKNATFTLEVVKTALLSGSGQVAPGQYTTFGNTLSGTPLFTTWLRGNSLTIVSPSCRVSNTMNFHVDLGNVSFSEFKGPGSTTGGRDFSIKLQCPGGAGVAGTRVNLTFDGNLAENTTVAQGVLRNEQQGMNVATGIGVQVLDMKHQLIEFRKANPVAILNSEAMQFLNLSYFARYYQYLPKASAGVVQSHMVFSISYD